MVDYRSVHGLLKAAYAELRAPTIARTMQAEGMINIASLHLGYHQTGGRLSLSLHAKPAIRQWQYAS